MGVTDVKSLDEVLEERYGAKGTPLRSQFEQDAKNWYNQEIASQNKASDTEE